jgi:predicted nucleotidyltransferase
VRPKKQGVLAYPLDAILGREANVRVLREMVAHGGYLSSSEVTRRTRLTKMSTLSSLHELESLRVTETAGSKNAILHKLSNEHPLAKWIVALFEGEAGRSAAIFHLIGENVLHAAPDAAAVWVYGSVARNEDGPGSDLDVAVVLRDDGEPQLVQDDLRARMAALGEAHKFRPSVVLLNETDVRRLADEGDNWWRAVSAEAKTIVGETPSALLSRSKRKSRSRSDQNRVN